MKKQFFKLSLLMVLFIGVASCSSDDDGGDSGSTTDLLFNKWWYIESDTTADFYFNSNGNYEQNIPFGGGIELFGTWEWIDEANQVMKITYDEGSNSGISSYYIKFTAIGGDTISVKFSFDDGETYGNERQYQDTEI